MAKDTWSVNAGFVCGERRTLIVDTGPTAYAAATILGYAQAARPGNTVMAVNTELHLDHLAGNSLLRECGIDVYGHPSIVRTDADLMADVTTYATSVIDPDRRDEARLPSSARTSQTQTRLWIAIKLWTSKV